MSATMPSCPRFDGQPRTADRSHEAISRNTSYPAPQMHSSNNSNHRADAAASTTVGLGPLWCRQGASQRGEDDGPMTKNDVGKKVFRSSVDGRPDQHYCVGEGRWEDSPLGRWRASSAAVDAVEAFFDLSPLTNEKANPAHVVGLFPSRGWRPRPPTTPPGEGNGRELPTL